MRFKVLAAAFGLCAMLAGCSDPANDPHAPGQVASNTLFTPFGGHSPRTLDTTSSYSNDETPFTYSICEPLYQFHYLKRPYELIGRTAREVAKPRYYDKEGKELPASAPGASVAESVYDIRIKPGILFAPHPAFARGPDGKYLYHHLTREEIRRHRSPWDFEKTGTRELTASDYVYAIRRLASPRVISPAFGLMREYIVGLDAYAKELAAEDRRLRQAAEGGPLPVLDLRRWPMPGAVALDDHTLRLRIRGKYPQMSAWLSMTFFAPIAWEAEAFYGQSGMREQNLSLAYWPVGTGPYMMREFIENRRHVMVRNPNFRRETFPCEGTEEDRREGRLADCGKPLPFIDRVVMQGEKEGVPMTAKFLQGYYDSPQIERLDQAQAFLIGAADSIDKEREYREKKLQFPKSVEASNWYVAFNWLDPVVGEGKTPEQRVRNRKLRQAISIAVDFGEMVTIFENGMGQPAHGPLPPGLFGYRADGPAAFNPVVFARGAQGRPQRRPIAEAKRLMAEAGYPGGRDAATGRPLVLNFDYASSASPAAKSLLEWYQKQFAKIDIQLEIRMTDYNRFQEKMNNGSAQIFSWGWLADYPDAENFLFLLYGPNGKAGSGGNGPNSANYCNPEYDRLFEQMKYLEDGPDKQRLIDAMISLAQQDAPWLFGYFPTSAAAFHQWVHNGKPSQIVRNHIQYLRLDPALRSACTRAWNRPVRWPLALIPLLVLAAVAAVARVLRRRDRLDAGGRRAGGQP